MSAITSTLAPEPRAAFDRISLRRLVLIRWVAVAGQALALLVVHYVLEFPLPLAPAFGVVGCSAALNLFFAFHHRAATRLGERQAAYFLGYDLLQLGLLLYLTGGPSHLDTFDPKPDAPAEYRGPFRSIPTAIPGVRFSELLPRSAARADRFAIVRYLSHRGLRTAYGEKMAGPYDFLAPPAERSAQSKSLRSRFDASPIDRPMPWIGRRSCCG